MSGPTPTTVVTPSLSRQWRRWRGPVAVIAALCGVALLLAWGTAGSQAEGDLDPEAVDSSGSRAVVSIVADQGVSVTPARDLDELNDAVTDDTLTVVTQSQRLDVDQLDELAAMPGDLLLVEPSAAALDTLAPGVAPAGEAARTTLEPRCSLPAADAAGAATVGAQVYTPRDSDDAEGTTTVEECYPSVGGAALLRLDVETGTGPDARERTVTVLSSGDPLRNGRLRDAGNAALALNLVGESADTVWFIPDRGISSGQSSVWDLLPRGFYLAVAQVGVAAVLLLLWRARRLGPLVHERLAVVVSATETTEGRARLYQARRASQRAADALRAGFLNRVRPVLGLTSSATREEILLTLTERSGRDRAEIESLLYGTQTNKGRSADADLVSFAEKLDELEREVLGGGRRG
ncbi:DUF4350 domain-containing protein [Spiractinospora alimapuensis]|uniref:DUF4350 domain-containing protein n=1 Tax=Spiractinospora alimapuensis TaxID=2820884 RepID=UPI001F1FA4DA|nr:DUF4350 domain-containing protein [Spiractinospora alimapuensis]QVQ54364.1 DUF4350 domain-containing protein [Spiractinospora alimapuensis]